MSDSTVEKNFRVSFSDTFFSSLATLPKLIQLKLLNMVNKFYENPHRKGMNLEQIQSDFKDSDGKKALCSIRVDRTYRVILSREDENYLFLFVAHHDNAYDWAARHKVLVNARTGIIQVYTVEDAGKVAVPSLLGSQNGAVTAEKLFAQFTDKELLDLGVPEDRLSLVRLIATQQDFYSAQNDLPSDVCEALGYLTQGMTISAVRRQMHRPEVQPDTPASTHLALALENRLNKQFVANVSSAENLDWLFSCPLDKWRIFLHPAQSDFVECDAKGSMKVTGSAGTGKTVVAMHRARYLAAQHLKRVSEGRAQNSGKVILVTTYTTNLAQDISDNLQKLCSPEELALIEVKSIDAWTLQYLKEHGFDYTICYNSAKDKEPTLRDYWCEAVAKAAEKESQKDFTFTPEFCQRVWERCVCDSGAFALGAFLKAKAENIGKPILAKERMALWEVFQEYRNLMEEKKLRDREYAMHDCAAAIREHDKNGCYESVIVDEAQDFSSCSWRLLRAIAGPEHSNDLFIVGDDNQRIYGRTVNYSNCGINIRGIRSRVLRLNYRTTEETRNFAMNVLKVAKEPCTSLNHGAPPFVKEFSSQDEEMQWLVDKIQELHESRTAYQDICVVFRTKKKPFSDYKRYFTSHGLKCYDLELKKTHKRVPGLDHIRIATMHRVKGLEFEYIFIVNARKSELPLESVRKKITDPVELAEFDTQEKCLLYVALTRAKRMAFVTGVKPLTKLLE